MIDKDLVELSALNENDIDAILCEFHLMKALTTQWKKLSPVSFAGDLMLLFKKIARAPTLETVCSRILQLL